MKTFILMALFLSGGVVQADLLPPTSHAAAAPQSAAVGSQKATLAIKGMMCTSCVNTVTSALEGVKGVSSAHVDLKKNVAWVSYDPKATNTDAMIKAIVDAGYQAKVSTQ